MAQRMHGEEEAREALRGAEAILGRATAELVLSGGPGGVVSYDGEGGPLIKRGGPVDRIYFLARQGMADRIDVSMPVYSGVSNYETGRLAGPVRIATDAERTIDFCFEANRDETAVEVRGGIPELDIYVDTVLFAATVEPSLMTWIVGSAERRGRMPFIGVHQTLFVHPSILEFFGVSGGNRISGGVSPWSKPCPVRPGDRDRFLESPGELGAPFKTAQRTALYRLAIGA